MREKKAISIGNIAIDCIIQCEPSKKESNLITSIEKKHGGAAGNVCSTLREQGIDATLLAPLPKDFENSEYCKKLHARKIKISENCLKTNSQIATCYVINNSEKTRRYWLSGCSGKTDEIKASPKYLEGFDAVHFASITPKWIENAKNCRLSTFNPGPSAFRTSKRLLKKALESCNILFANERELKQIKKTLTARSEKELFSEKMQTIVLTKGEKGSEIITPKGKIKINAEKGPVKDTTGAGDVYCATFIAARLNEIPLAESGKIASMAASYSTTKIGAQNKQYKSKIQKKVN